MRAKKVFASICIAILGQLLFGAPVFADNWQARLYEAGSPQLLVGVDKKNHTFNLFEKNSPLKLRFSYPCVTGQLHGDKQQVNDLRTPEGIYFVEYKIDGGLDFREYGGIAYTLNYPNPVDRLRGKTGHGIWIHSKGFGLVPTRGCVAINLRHINEVGPLLTPGTAVVLAEELGGIGASDNGALDLLKEKMRDWSAAWGEKSSRMFDFYNPDAYSRATESFSAFRQNKERLFKILDFIKIYNREIHALEGPGYWVTWSEQFYTASNLSTEGIRRLYWQKDDKGDFRIVGMEWIPRDVGMKADLQKGRLVAAISAPSVTDAGFEAPKAPRIDMPEAPPVAEKLPAKRVEPAFAQMGDRVNSNISRSIEAMATQVAALGDPLVPKPQPRIDQPDEIIWGSGRKLTEPASKPVQAPAASQGVAAPAKKATTPDSSGAIQRELGVWLNAYRKKDLSILDLYDQKQFNRLPANSGVPRKKSYNASIQDIRAEFKQPWLEMVHRTPHIENNGAVIKVEFDQMIISPQGRREGLRTLWWNKTEDGQYKIVAADFQPRALGLDANYLEAVSGDVSSTIEAWRKAWESGALDEYMEFYAKDANQQGKIGQNSIRRQKSSLWSRVHPASVKIGGLRLALDPKGIRADMTQAYQDSAGRSDKGVKTLLLRYDGQRWLIQHEDWTNAAAQALLQKP